MREDITLLYVDDEPINIMLFEVNFKKYYRVITAVSGNDGLSKLKSDPEISILISDMKMPGMNGIEFIRLAKQDFHSLHCMILTGFDVTDDITIALEEKLICKYLSKPFDLKQIMEAITEAVSQ
jgi:response regulator RpfG family c-di-GMP phosphodiesterase